MIRVLCALLLSWSLLAQQAPSKLDENTYRAAMERVLDLAGAAGFASPELGRAAAPIVENMRQSYDAVKATSVRQPQKTYAFLTNLRAFLVLSDTLPKPDNYPEEARRQGMELRERYTALESFFESQIAQIQRDVNNPDRDNLKRFAADNAQLPAPSPAKPRTVFMGDSITDFWRLNEYFPDRDFVNRGISGQITGQMLGRFNSDVVRLKPAAVLILAGTNDIARNVDSKTIENNIEMMCDLADKNGIKVILASLLPINDYGEAQDPRMKRSVQRPPALIQNLNAWLANFAQRRGYVYLNYYPAMIDATGSLSKELADDGLHPNAAGYRVMAPLALAAIEKAAIPPQPAARKRRLL